jgi:hypothetical protein
LQGLPKKLIAPANAAAVLLAAFCLAYLGDAGHGFIKDDFRWIRETRVESFADAARLFERTDGFYRPLVSLTFAASSATFGLTPRPYGLTNLCLTIVNAILIWLLARRLGLGHGPALLAAGTWAFNFHGINMAILWISGRTALMLTLCALLAGIATAAGRMWLAGLCCLLAMLSKEEAVLLPLVLSLWSAYDTSGTVAQRAIAATRRAWPCFAAVAVYLVLRLQTEAFWPADAPSYYRLTPSPLVLAANLFQYADRAITWPAVAALVTYAASARQAALTATEKRIVAFGAIWLAGLFALTVFVPVRSSLYAVAPSVGAALAAGAVASAALRASPQRTTAALTVLALLPVLLVPIYWRRNERWVRLADFSTDVVDQVRTALSQHPVRGIVIVDAPSERFNMESAFGSLWPDAAALFVPAATTTVVNDEPPAESDALVFRLEHGRLVQR